uniref:hypothetical protein n=3 Tax=Xanthomonas phaseoli TaxID=1985254 RepID=UPI001EE64CB6
AASMPPYGPATGRGTALSRLLLLIGTQCFKQVLMPEGFVADVTVKAFICSCISRNGCPEKRAVHLAVGISFRDRQQSVVFARVPMWDLERHGCHASACMDVLAACPRPVRVQATAADRSIHTEPADTARKASNGR